MQVKACVLYKGGVAHYHISQEHEGIFQAQLDRYDGKPNYYPPVKVTLIKGENQWVGTPQEPLLLKTLSSVVDKKLTA